MENVTFIESENLLTNEITEHAIIEHADGSFTSMLKSTYDAQQAEQSTPILPA
jgi:hypothetical protein